MKKILLIGAPNVGKTTFLRKLKTGNFDNRRIETVGSNVHRINFNDHELEIWDIGGTNVEQLSSYCNNVDGIMIMYSGEDRTVFEYMQNVDKNNLSLTLPIVIIKNKSGNESRRGALMPILQDIYPNEIFRHTVIDTELDFNITKPLELLFDN